MLNICLKQTLFNVYEVIQ